MSPITDIDTRRSEQDHQARRQLEDEYREHAATVDRYLAGTFGTALAADERETLRQQAFVGLADEIAKGTEIRSTEAMLITCARNAAYSLLRSADRRRRFTFDPQDSPESRRPDPTTVAIDVAVVEADEDRRVKMLVDQLDERSRMVLQLRLEFEMEMPEIADRLGVSTSHAYKLLKGAGTALSDAIAANNDGAHSRQQRALLTTCELGTATDQQRDQAERMLDADTHARALLAEIRGLGHQAAALMPPVAIGGGAAPPSSERISDMLSSVKQYASDLLGRGASAQETATHVAASGGLRGSGAVGNLVVAGVLACVGAGGGYAATVCIDQGPAALVDKLPGTDDSNAERQEQIVEAPVAPAVEPLTTTPQQLTAQPQPTTTDPAADAQAASEPAPAPASGSDSVGGLNGNPTATPAPAPPPPPTVSTGGGGGGSSSGATFGGL
jgi:RNA polymerase sigma factor (sigma-70 family)